MGVLDRFRRTPTPAPVPVIPRVTKRSYAAAAVSRLFGKWATTLVSVDQELEAELGHLVSRSRDLTQNNPLAAAAARVFVENVAGPEGMLCTPQVTTRAGDLRSPINRKLAAGFADWGAPDTCTVDGRQSWVDLQRMAVRTWAVEGEFFAIKHRGKQVNRYGFALQPIDPDLVDRTHNQRRGTARNEIRMGVELDDLERPVAFHVLTEHPSRGARTRKRIPAEQVVHLFEQLRPGQTRGVPRGAAAMARLKMVDQYDEFELGAAQLSAGLAVLFKQSADAPELLGEDGKPLPAEIPLAIEAMMGKLLPPGVDPFTLASEHPTTAYEAYSRASRRDVAVGYGLAYSTLTGDLTQASYGSLRDGSLKERDLFRGYHRMFATHFCAPIYRAWLEQAVLTNAITLPSQNADEWNAVAFSGRGWPWIDSLKDITATEREIKLGLNSRQAAARAMGRNYEDVLRETSEDLAEAAAWGVPVMGTENVVATGAPATTEGTDDDSTDD